MLACKNACGLHCYVSLSIMLIKAENIFVSDLVVVNDDFLGKWFVTLLLPVKFNDSENRMDFHVAWISWYL